MSFYGQEVQYGSEVLSNRNNRKRARKYHRFLVVFKITKTLLNPRCSDVCDVIKTNLQRRGCNTPVEIRGQVTFIIYINDTLDIQFHML